MKKVFTSTGELDKRAVSLGLSELVLQENASAAVAKVVKERYKGALVLGFCGGGNNGADALAALRRLCGEYECVAVLVSDKLNNNATTQLKIAKSAGLKVIKANEIDENTAGWISEALKGSVCVIDGIFGAGFKGELNPKIATLIASLNEAISANPLVLALSVDMPSGLDIAGIPSPLAFRANTTITMGAPKLGLFSDLAKDYVGELICADLGLCEGLYASGVSSDFLLEMSDMRLPNRIIQNVNKGDFGHAFVASGDMSGAARLCALSALNMGAGRVSIVAKKKLKDLEPEIMLKRNFSGASAVAIGMGLGGELYDIDEILALPCVVDADMFYHPSVLSFCAKAGAVLTPHPKEFASLLAFAGFGEFSVNEVVLNRFALARAFSQKFPATLVLKGANTIIANASKLYINCLGSAKLAKGGSGDVLSGMILALLAQGYDPLLASITATLAQAKIAANYSGSAFSYTPKDMIKGIKCL